MAPHPLVTTTRASSGDAAMPQGSAGSSRSQRAAIGDDGSAAGSSTARRVPSESVAATRPSGKTSSCRG